MELRGFQQVFGAKPTGEGTGLGLSISYNITQPDTGTIEIDGASGGFTEFLFQFAEQVRLDTNRGRGMRLSRNGFYVAMAED